MGLRTEMFLNNFRKISAKVGFGVLIIFAAALGAVSTGAFGFTFFNSGPVSVRAAAGDNTFGFAWSENIGWLSFNNANCDADDSGFSDGLLPGCPPAGTPNSFYGVKMDVGSGSFSGYAWAEHIGWISFAPAGPYPSNPQQPAKLDLVSRRVSGWARACAVFVAGCSGVLRPDSERGGWDGWIKLSKGSADGGANYGVSVDVSSNFHGYAWGSAVVGWISFNCLEGSGSGGSVCGSSSYKVYMSGGPQAGSLRIAGLDYCDAVARAITLEWEYFDPYGQNETRFDFMVDNDSDFSSPNIDRSFFPISNPSPTTQNQQAQLSLIAADSTCNGCDRIGYNTAYFWRVRVWDAAGNNSGWVEFNDLSDADGDGNPATFTTSPHSWPLINFSWTANPSVGEPAQFTDQSEVFGGATKSSWSWNIPDAAYLDGTSDASQNPRVEFTSSGIKTVGLGVYDSDGFYCSAAKTLEIGKEFPLPWWREIAP